MRARTGGHDPIDPATGVCGHWRQSPGGPRMFCDRAVDAQGQHDENTDALDADTHRAGEGKGEIRWALA